MIGQTISHYKILDKLGEGGMGVVYKAHDSELERDVALKFLPNYLTSDPTEKERFYHEARAASALNHPNVTTIYEIKEYEDPATKNRQLYIAMEYVQGETLKHLVGSDTLTIRKVLDIAIQICEGLAAAHEQSIVHRDIKSENIIITPKGQAKIMDFGLAKVQGATKLTKTGSTIGTAAYMSPEQARGEDVDQRSDLFSLGVVCYEMFAGRLPFRGEHVTALMYSITNEEPPPLARFNEKITDEIQRIVSKALEKEREDRYQHADDILSDLRRERKKLEYARSGYTTTPVSGISSASGTHQQVPAMPNMRKWVYGGLGGILVIGIATILMLLFAKQSDILNHDWTQRTLEIPFTDMGAPAISGDGNWIAFSAKDQEAVIGIYIMNVRQGGPRLLTTIQNQGWLPAVDLSPDGGLLLYYLVDNKAAGTFDGYVIYSNGGSSRRIIQGGHFSRFLPDGQRVGFFRSNWSAFQSQSAMNEWWSVGIDGADPRREFIDSLSRTSEGHLSFSYSPDCKRVAYLRSYPEKYEEIIIHELATGREKEITTSKKNINEVLWCRGNKILYTTNRNGIYNIWMVSADGGEPVQITKGNEAIVTTIQASADGQRLIYGQGRRVADFWIVDIAENRSRKITYAEENIYAPAFSPDGRQIALLVASPEETGVTVEQVFNSTHLYVMDRDGKNRKQLTFGEEIASSPVWSPDGKRIAYGARKITESADSTRSYIIESTNPGSPRYLTAGRPDQWLDSARLMVVRSGIVYLTSIASPSPRRVYNDSTWSEYICGGRYILSFDYRVGLPGKRNFWIIDVTEPPEVQQKHARKLSWINSGVMLDGPGKFLYQIRSAGEIWRMSLPDGKEEHLQADFLGAEPFQGFTASWDGKEIIVVKARGESRIVMIENLFK